MMKIMLDPYLYLFIMSQIIGHKKKEIRLVSCNIYTIHLIFKGEKESFWHHDWLFAKRKDYIDIFKQLDLNDTLCQWNEMSVIQ